MESNIPEVVEISGLMQETKDRVILMHLPTSTIAELLDIGEYPESDNIFNFSFINSEGVNEELRLLVHKSDYDKNEADEIIPVLEKIADYYITYAYWEDGNIRRDFKIKLN